MPISVKTFLEKGYIPIACNTSAGIAWQGEHLDDFWMWNRQYMDDSNGCRTIQTVRVSTVKEAALRCWKDGWVAVKPLDERLVKRMESALREHRGLKCEGVSFPDGPFLVRGKAVPSDAGKETANSECAQIARRDRKRHCR